MLTTTAPARPRPRRGLTAALGTLGALAALCACLLGTASPAAAHAVLTDSSPASGAVVSSAPEQVTLTFSESVRLTEDAIRVLGPDGKRADTSAVRDLGTDDTPRYATPLRDDLPDGTYTVTWQAVSADSHPISGAFTFSVGAPSKTTVELPGKTAGGGLLGALYGTARYAAYTGFLLLVGGAAFVLTCWKAGARVRAVQRVVTTGWVGLTAATLTMLLLRAPYVGSGELADALDLDALSDVVGSKTGTALVSRLLLLAAAALFTSVLFDTYRAEDGPEQRRDVVVGLALGGTVVAVGLATTWAAAGHASTGPQSGIALPVDILHLLAVAAWLGGLAALAAGLWSGAGAVPPAAARRFSRVALASVTVLAATGLYQSWRQVGTWSALTGTDYGRLLMVKAGLVTALVALGWYSRRWTARLSPSETGDGDRATAPPAGDEDVPPTGSAVSPAATPDPGPGSPDRPKTQSPPTTPEPAPAEGGLATQTVADDAGDHAAAGDPVREAQLARQRRAVRDTQRKRARNADPHRTRLRRSVLAESAVAVAVVAVTTLLSGTEPARTAEATGTAQRPGPSAEAPAPVGPLKITVPFDTGGPQGQGTAQVTLTPGGTGRNTLHVWLLDPDRKPLDVPEVTLSFTLPAKDIGPLRVTPEKAAYGHWTQQDVQLPVPGTWKMTLSVRTSDIDRVTQTRTLRIR